MVVSFLKTINDKTIPVLLSLVIILAIRQEFLFFGTEEDVRTHDEYHSDSNVINFHISSHKKDVRRFTEKLRYCIPS